MIKGPCLKSPKTMHFYKAHCTMIDRIDIKRSPKRLSTETYKPHAPLSPPSVVVVVVVEVVVVVVEGVDVDDEVLR